MGVVADDKGVEIQESFGMFIVEDEDLCDASRMSSSTEPTGRKRPPIHAETVSTDASSSSSFSPQDILTPHHIDQNSFQRLGIAILSAQAIATLAMSLFAWYVDNGLLELPFTWLCQLWFLVTIWKASFSYQQNSWLYRASAVITLLSWNMLFLQAQSPGLRVHGIPIIARSLMLTVFMGFFEVTGKCLRQSHILNRTSEEHFQGQLDTMAMSSVVTSLNSGFIVIYLMIDTLSNLGQTSYQEIAASIQLLNEHQALDPEQTVYTYADHDANEILDAVILAYEATLVGGALNGFLLFTFVVNRVAHFSFSDILNLRVTVSEAMVAIAQLIMVTTTLIFLGMGVFLVGNGSETNSLIYTLSMSFIMLVGLVGVVSSGILARSISRGDHPYYLDRVKEMSAIAPSERTNDESLAMLEGQL